MIMQFKFGCYLCKQRILQNLKYNKIKKISQLIHPSILLRGVLLMLLEIEHQPNNLPTLQISN